MVQERRSAPEPEALGPFCGEVDGQFRCKSRDWLCGCRSTGCRDGKGLDRRELENLDFTHGLVRMATFKQLMKVPSCICPSGRTWRRWLDNSWVLWLLGGSVEWRSFQGAECTPCMEAPSHAWSEIELPRSQCYLMLGGGTSPFRDRGDSAFRLLLHDTSFRHVAREGDKLVYEGLLLHSPLPLRAGHLQLLRHLIQHGEIRQLPFAETIFERSLDQDFDLNPLFLEMIPDEFVFKDEAMASMVAAYFGLFNLRWALAWEKPWMNCVVTALLFGLRPKQLLSMVPLATHQAIRHHANEMNYRWQQFRPVLERAHEIFQPFVQVPDTSRTWGWWSTATKSERLSGVEQIQRFRWRFLQKALVPLGELLEGTMAEQWSAELPWSFQILRCQESFQETLLQRKLSGSGFASGELQCVQHFLSMESSVCDSEVEGQLFCPEQHGSSPSSLVTDTERVLRKLLYWDAVAKIKEPPNRLGLLCLAIGLAIGLALCVFLAWRKRGESTGGLRVTAPIAPTAGVTRRRPGAAVDSERSTARRRSSRER
ncbi:unnamed protein product [Effrenium voratum]|nr:unnamed protein product [Effrenium voratum]